jgi:putative PIN family toxin of toxin-antitoxin system
MPGFRSLIYGWHGIAGNTKIGYYSGVKCLQIVLDTNVLVAALRSNLGAAFLLLSLIGRSAKFEINLSVPLVMEYEDVTLRSGLLPKMSRTAITDTLDYLCTVGSQREIFFLWRPFLKDPKDDMVLEVAVEAECEYIVTFNQKDFVGVEQFGIQALPPHQFLRRIGELT